MNRRWATAVAVLVAVCMVAAVALFVVGAQAWKIIGGNGKLSTAEQDAVEFIPLGVGRPTGTRS